MGGPWMACTYGTGYGHHWAPKHGPFHHGSERILTPFASMRMLAWPMKVILMTTPALPASGVTLVVTTALSYNVRVNSKRRDLQLNYSVDLLLARVTDRAKPSETGEFLYPSASPC